MLYNYCTSVLLVLDLIYNLDNLDTVGRKAVQCMLTGFYSTHNYAFDDLPIELEILYYMIADINSASLEYRQNTVINNDCLNPCLSLQTCTTDVSQYQREIPKIFNATIYGAGCAKKLEKKREQLESSGLLSRILDEVAFLGCLSARVKYVHCVLKIKF